MFGFNQDLDIILKTLDISSVDLCRQLGFDMPTVSNWLNGKFEPDNRSKEDIYTFAYEKGLRLNIAYELPLQKLGDKQGFKCLYHGSKQGLKGKIDLKHSKNYNDLGKGFYLGESLEQSSMFVSNNDRSHVYSFGLFLNDLNVFNFESDIDWVITISYYRNLLNRFSSSKKLEKIINKSKSADIIVAPITDNRMLEIIGEFAEGYISGKACAYALSTLDLGKQYVLKTQKSINNLAFIKEYYECEMERKEYQNNRIEKQSKRLDTIRNFRSKYRKSEYIEDLL